LRSSEIYVYGIGEKKTPMAFRNACDDFIFTENLIILENETDNNEKIEQKPEEKEKKPESVANQNDNITTLLNIACETYGDDDGWTYISSAGSYIKRSMPDFDSKNYGFSKLTELIASFDNLYEMKKYKGKGTVKIYRKKEQQ
jgi:hypothetical protein